MHDNIHTLTTNPARNALECPNLLSGAGGGSRRVAARKCWKRTKVRFEKRLQETALQIGFLLLFAVTASAQIIVPGANGTDGALNITTNTVIDLSQAVTAAWDSDNTANIGKGVYDSNKWAVVFKYTSVNVATGATVTFVNHPSRAPVVWLVSGDVTIDGTVSLNGQSGVSAPNLSEPGPGGFRGGTAEYSSQVFVGSGMGVGGGQRAKFGSGVSAVRAQGGSHGTEGGNGGSPAYGNPSLVPLLGGSGGGGARNTDYGAAGSGGGAGGGAMLIACEQTVSINGGVRANGGAGVQSGATTGGMNAFAGGGAGGGIRIVSDELIGLGQINALGASGAVAGGNGRVRLERVENLNSYIVTPAPSVVDLSPGSTALLWPPTNAPQVRILSIGGTDAPADPRATFGTYGADVALPVTNQAVVLVETINVETQSQVRVRITPRDTFNASEIGASYQSTVTNDPLTVLWSANMPANLGYSAVQVKVIRP